MATLTDPQIDAFAAIIEAHINGTRTYPGAPAIAATFLQDFRDTIGDATMKPIVTVFKADPKNLKAPWEGNVNLPMLAIWRSEDAWKEFSWDMDQDSAVAMYKWALPSDADTEKVWPLLNRFVYTVRRIFEWSVEDPTDLAILNAGGVTEFAIEIKAKYGYDGPAQEVLYPTATGAFSFKHHWERNEANLGLSLPAFAEADTRHNLVGADHDGDAEPVINPTLTSRAKLT